MLIVTSYLVLSANSDLLISAKDDIALARLQNGLGWYSLSGGSDWQRQDEDGEFLFAQAFSPPEFRDSFYVSDIKAPSGGVPPASYPVRSLVETKIACPVVYSPLARYDTFYSTDAYSDMIEVTVEEDRKMFYLYHFIEKSFVKGCRALISINSTRAIASFLCYDCKKRILHSPIVFTASLLIDWELTSYG